MHFGEQWKVFCRQLLTHTTAATSEHRGHILRVFQSLTFREPESRQIQQRPPKAIFKTCPFLWFCIVLEYIVPVAASNNLSHANGLSLK